MLRRYSAAQKKSRRKLRCAIYTRKSTEDFNSLDAQREACEAFIVSQKHEGWVALPNQYDDGGYCETLEQPALLADIRRPKVDVVEVYKWIRLTRSLLEFRFSSGQRGLSTPPPYGPP